jgi:hypothetical protein
MPSDYLIRRNEQTEPIKKMRKCSEQSSFGENSINNFLLNIILEEGDAIK